MLKNARHEHFAQLVASGMSHSEAFRKTHNVNGSTDKTIWENASKLASKVLPRIEEIKQELVNKYTWTREQSVEALKAVVQSPDKQSDVIAAVKELNVMHGFNAPIKIEHSGDGKNKAIVFEVIGASNNKTN